MRDDPMNTVNGTTRMNQQLDGINATGPGHGSMGEATTTGACPVLGRGGTLCDNQGDGLVDLRSVAAQLAVSTRTIHRLIAAGELPPPVKVGRASRWFRADVLGYLARLRDGRSQRFGVASAGGER